MLPLLQFSVDGNLRISPSSPFSSSSPLKIWIFASDFHQFPSHFLDGAWSSRRRPTLIPQLIDLLYGSLLDGARSCGAQLLADEDVENRFYCCCRDGLDVVFLSLVVE
ncbi:hypothetical protein Droror1_Dr00008327 [Drosera rotundifolia]